MSKALKEKNMPHTFITFLDDYHETNDPGIQLAHSALAETFLAQHLGVKSEPFGEDLSYSSFIVHEGEEFIQGLQEALRKPSKSLHLAIKLYPVPIEDQWLSGLIANELNSARTQLLKMVPSYQNYYRPVSLKLFARWFLLSIFKNDTQ